MALPGGSGVGAFIVRNGGFCCTNRYRPHQLYGGFQFDMNSLQGRQRVAIAESKRPGSLP